jgi:hypothetical protein
MENRYGKIETSFANRYKYYYGYQAFLSIQNRMELEQNYIQNIYLSKTEGSPLCPELSIQIIVVFIAISSKIEKMLSNRK